MDSIRKRILTAIEQRLAIITQNNGFNTNCGIDVSRNAVASSPDECPCIRVWAGKDEVVSYESIAVLQMQVDVELSQVRNSLDDSAGMIEDMLADAIEAMTSTLWAGQFTLGVYPGQPGDIMIGQTSGAYAIIQGVEVISGSFLSGDASGNVYYRRADGVFVDEPLTIGGLQDSMTFLGNTATGTSDIDLTTAGLATGIDYLQGGTDNFPEPGGHIVSCSASFNIRYRIRRGDPYHNK